MTTMTSAQAGKLLKQLKEERCGFTLQKEKVCVQRPRLPLFLSVIAYSVRFIVKKKRISISA